MKTMLDDMAINLRAPRGTRMRLLVTALTAVLPAAPLFAADLAPPGARIGAFDINLEAEASAQYNSNVYATDGEELDDMIGRFASTLRLASDTSRYKLDLEAGATHLEYDKRSGESRTDLNGKAALELEPLRATFIRARGGAARTHEDRGSPDSPAAATKPVRYDRFEGGLGLARELGRLQASIDADYVGLRYQNGELGDGTLVNNKDRDRDQGTATIEISYEVSPGYALLARASADRVRYRQALDDNDYNRESDGQRYEGGVRFALSNLLEGDIRGGWIKRDYKDDLFSEISGASYGADLTWTPSRLTRVILSGDRSIEETTQSGYKGMLQSAGGLRLEHELTRTVTFRAGGRYVRSDYKLAADASDEQLADPRRDEIYIANAGLRYQLNRQMTLGGSFEWSRRNSTAPNSDYNRKEASLSFRLAL